MFKIVTKKKLLKAYSSITYGNLNILLPDGDRLSFCGKYLGYDIQLKFNNWKAVNNFFKNYQNNATFNYKDHFTTNVNDNWIWFYVQNESMFHPIKRNSLVKLIKLFFPKKSHDIANKF